MNNTKTHDEYNDVIWYDEALQQMPALMPVEESCHTGPSLLLETVTEADIHENPDRVCIAFLESIKIPGRDILSNPDKATKAIQAAVKVVRNPTCRNSRTGSFLAALACLFSACQPGNVLSNTKVGHVMSEKYSSVAELASASSSELDEIISSASDSIQPEQNNRPQSDNHKTVQYPAGNTITIMFTELGKNDSEYSTNESIKTFKQLESVAQIEGCDKEYLGRIKIVVNVIDPYSDTIAMAKIKKHNSSTAFTDGISMIDSVPTIVISSIPIPNTKSLANLLSHEVKHPFPFIMANLIRKHPLYKEIKLNMVVQNYIAYSNELDKMEHIVKTLNEWNIGGTPFNPLQSVISNNCIVKLNNLLKKRQK